MLEDRPQLSNPARRPVTDSPWFWLFLFLAAALAAVGVVSPKYSHRLARLERMNETRDEIARRAAGDPGTAEDEALFVDVGAEPSRTFTLAPLAVVLSILLALSAVAAGIVSYLRSAARRGDAIAQRKTA